jgi:hypothetical protein
MSKEKLISYLAAIEAREAKQRALNAAIQIEKRLAKQIYEEESYPTEILLVVSSTVAISIDLREENFEVYDWPDSPIKIHPVQLLDRPA